MPAGFDGGEPDALLGEARVTDGVDTAVLSVQAARSKTAGDSRRRDPQREKLLGRDDRVVGCGEAREAKIGPRVAFLSHTERKATQGRIHPPRAAPPPLPAVPRPAP